MTTQQCPSASAGWQGATSPRKERKYIKYYLYFQQNKT